MLKFFLLLAILLPPLWSCSRDDVPRGTVNGFDKNVLLRLVNDARKKGCDCGGTKMPAVPALTWNDVLAKVAAAHSRDMNTKNYFSHTNSKGDNAGDRLKAAGYLWGAYGENIAYNNGDEQAVMEGWLESPSHCRTLMSPLYKEIGVGRDGAYWTQDFGTKR
jgi:uncharacterized protein YkwD